MLLREGELALFMLRSPNLPIPAVFSVPSVLIYDTREAPYVRHLRGGVLCPPQNLVCKRIARPGDVPASASLTARGGTVAATSSLRNCALVLATRAAPASSDTESAGKESGVAAAALRRFCRFVGADRPRAAGPELFRVAERAC